LTKSVHCSGHSYRLLFRRFCPLGRSHVTFYYKSATFD